MARYLHVFVKFFSCEKYRNEFLDGKLYMNTIEYFKKYEEVVNSNIADKNEALMAWLQPNDVKVKLQLGETEYELSSKDFAAPLTISVSAHNKCNVFCLTYFHSHNIDVDSPFDTVTFNKLQSYFTLGEGVEELGEFAVMINPTVFLKRVKENIEILVENKQVHASAFKPVTYYDEVNSSLALNVQSDAVFHKQSKYSHQSEFRVCIFRDNELNEPFVLDIGDVRDITEIIDTKDLNKYFQLDWNDH